MATPPILPALSQFSCVLSAACLLLTSAPLYAAEGVEVTFNNHCASCHGVGGAGDGPAAYLVYPKPRDFTSGVFRFKSTPDSQLPTHDDLRRTISDGIARTAMPAFRGVLSAEQIDGLIQFVLSLNQNEATPAEVEPIDIPVMPPLSAALAGQGKLLYTGAGCNACHGDTGQGDGPSSLTLKDAQDYPLPPADFTTGIFKAGRTPQDLYRTIVVGVPGTPMPSFAETLNEVAVDGIDQGPARVWAVVAYLQSLIQPREIDGLRSGTEIEVTAAADAAMFGDALHISWRSVAPVSLSLQPLWQRRHSTAVVKVRAVRDAERLALHLEWEDR